MFSLKSIFSRFRNRITGTFALLLLENILMVAQPFAFGIAINDLLAGSVQGLFVIVGLYACSLLLGVLRRMYDTRAYGAIYAVIAPEMIERQKELGVSDSAIVTRSGLVKELVDFFENDLTQGFTAMIRVLGSVVMLLVLDYRLFLGCVLAIGLIAMIYTLSEKGVYRANKAYNDQLETQVNVITGSQPIAIIRHYQMLTRWQVKISDREAVNFGLIEAIIIALAVYSLFIAVQTADPTAGSIFSTLSYMLEFGEGVYILPWIFQQFIRLKEISTRLEMQL